MTTTEPEARLILRIRTCTDSRQLEHLFNEVCRKIHIRERTTYIVEINAREDYLSGVFYRNKGYLEQ